MRRGLRRSMLSVRGVREGSGRYGDMGRERERENSRGVINQGKGEGCLLFYLCIAGGGDWG